MDTATLCAKHGALAAPNPDYRGLALLHAPRYSIHARGLTLFQASNKLISVKLGRGEANLGTGATERVRTWARSVVNSVRKKMFGRSPKFLIENLAVLTLLRNPITTAEKSSTTNLAVLTLRNSPALTPT